MGLYEFAALLLAMCVPLFVVSVYMKVRVNKDEAEKTMKEEEAKTNKGEEVAKKGDMNKNLDAGKTVEENFSKSQGRNAGSDEQAETIGSTLVPDNTDDALFF